jgi:hypothetical protein
MDQRPVEEQIEHAKKELKSAARGDPDSWRHPDIYPDAEDQVWIKRHREYNEKQANGEMDELHGVAPMPIEYRAAHDFLSAIFGANGYPPDTVAQLVEVFLPCLKIMVDHDWGELWRKAGFNSLMVHTGSKFERYWERTWIQGKRHADSGFDAINFLGFTLRADPNDIWGVRGKPAWSNEMERPSE